MVKGGKGNEENGNSRWLQKYMTKEGAGGGEGRVNGEEPVCEKRESDKLKKKKRQKRREGRMKIRQGKRGCI